MKPLALVAIVLGVVFLAVCVMYFITPAGSLPGFVPGYQPGATGTHRLHGIASLVVAVVLFALAWFQSKPQKAA